MKFFDDCLNQVQFTADLQYFGCTYKRTVCNQTVFGFYNALSSATIEARSNNHRHQGAEYFREINKLKKIMRAMNEISSCQTYAI